MSPASPAAPLDGEVDRARSTTRDRIIACGAVIVLVALGAAVVTLVLGAQRSGIETRTDLRLEQARAEAGRMESRVRAAFSSTIAVHGGPGTYSMAPGDAADSTRIQPQNPDASTGIVLVDRDGVVVNGSLLREAAVIGTTLVREDLDRALAGEPVILPIDEGLTTSRPTVAVAVPTRDEAGQLSGAALLEVEIAPDSAFNQEIAALGTGDTGGFHFVDGNGVVVASNRDGLLARPLDEPVVRGFEDGFHRDGGKVAAIAAVPSAGWKAVFAQDVDEFEGDLTGPLQTALLLFLGAVGIIGVFAALALLRRLQTAREEQRRLREIAEAREEFTSIVSHELRTPVAGLLGFLQTTIDHWDTMAEVERRRAVARAFSNARSLQTLTTDVLDSASIESRTLTYHFEPVDVTGCVEEAVARFRDATGSRPIAVSKPGDAVMVRADPLRIQQVLTNLLDNAEKSSAPDSPIDVSVAVDGRVVIVSVRDRGPGIAEDEQERIFEKFIRGRAGAVRGSGLGLYISRHIIEAHGGEISAESVPGEPGARLSFTLRLAA